MNPETPSSESSQYQSDPTSPKSSGPFVGDKAFVGIDVVLFLASTAWSFSLLPARTDEAMQQMASQPAAQKPTPEMMQGIMMATTGGCSCIFLLIYIFLWINMIKGKKWSFIVTLVLSILGVGLSVMGLSGVGMPLAIFGMVTGLAKAVYSGLRMVGKVGPMPS